VHSHHVWNLVFVIGDRHHSVAIRSTAGMLMADDTLVYTTWLPVIGRALARLALERATHREPDKYKELLDRVKFLEGLGLPQADAAEAAGSTAESVRVAKFNRNKAKKNGKKGNKKARGRRR
jgi:hypothetical protein